jgi:AAHS family 4-hydroxybenzoate transporter-like MFS transporter
MDATTQKTDLSRLIDSRPLSGLQIRVIILCGLVVLLDGYDIQTMSLAVPSLAPEWGLHRSAFGWALSAALIGMMGGAMILGPLGDRWGRRPVLIAMMLVLGVSSLLTGLATSVTELVIWRLLTGLALGASLPNATALTSEYVPARRRAALVILMYCNVAIGAFIAGFVAPPIIGAFGWRAIFYVGGIIPLIIAVLLWTGAPESVKLLFARNPQDPRIRRILARLVPDVDAGTVQAHAPGADTRSHSVLELLSKEFRARTTLLWCVYILNSFVLFLLVTWLPALLQSAGWEPAQALRGSVMIQAGGVMGGLLLSSFVDRGKTVPGMVSAYIITAVCLGLFLVIPADGGGWWLLLLVIGGGISGSQFALTALAAAFYPPVIRAAGVGWGLGVARIGAILAPLAGAQMAAHELSTTLTLSLLIVPVLICSLSVLLLPKVWRPS